MSPFPEKIEGKFKYLETSADKEETIVLLHGLMGGMSNFTNVINHFQPNYNVILPTLPIYELSIISISMQAYVDFLVDFFQHKNYGKVHLVGNSLGGHIGLMFTLQHQERVASLTLTGSSGLYESAMGTSFPKRGSYEYIENKTKETFYDPAIATKELVDELFDTVNDRSKAIRIVATSKSAVRNNLGDKLHLIKIPTLLIWGKQDIVTPPFVGEKFNELISGSKLCWIDQCGHAPMMEHPEQFNQYLETFLKELKTI